MNPIYKSLLGYYRYCDMPIIDKVYTKELYYKTWLRFINQEKEFKIS